MSRIPGRVLSLALAAAIVALSPGLPLYEACASTYGKDRLHAPGKGGVGEHGRISPEAVDVDAPLDAGSRDIPIESVELNGAAPDSVNGVELRPQILGTEAGIDSADAKTQAALAGTEKTMVARAVVAPLARIGALLRRDGGGPRVLNKIFGTAERKDADLDAAGTRPKAEGAVPAAARLEASKDAAAKRNAWKFYGSSAASQGSLEFGTVGGPALMDTVPGNARSMLPDVAIVGYLAMLAGRLTGAFWANRYSPRLAYIGLMVAGLGFMALQTGMVWIGVLTLPLLMLTMGGYRYSGSASVIAENGIINTLSKNDTQAIKENTAKVGLATSIVATALPFFSGYLIKYQGVVSVLILSVGLQFLAIGLLAWFRSSKTGDPEAPRRMTFRETLGELRRSLTEGWKLAIKSPLLRATVVSMVLLAALIPAVFSVFIPNYTDMIIQMGLAAAADKANLYTTMFTAVGVGGILANLRMSGIGKPKEAAGEPGPERLAERNEAARRDMLRWSLAAIFGIGLLAVFAWPLPPLGGVISLPWILDPLKHLTAPVFALAAFAFLLNTAIIHLRAFFTSHLPTDLKLKNDAYGVYQALFILASIVALAMFKFPFSGELPFGYKPIRGFTGLEGALPFIIAGALMLAVALAAYRSRSRIDERSKPADKR